MRTRTRRRSSSSSSSCCRTTSSRKTFSIFRSTMILSCCLLIHVLVDLVRPVSTFVVGGGVGGVGGPYCAALTIAATLLDSTCDQYSSSTRLSMAAAAAGGGDHPEPEWNSNDPWRVLGVSIGSDRKVVKRAYRRLAMRYHPDVAEGDKTLASERFAKINWAYEVASGRRRDAAASSSSTGTTTTTGGWEPPHRRKSGAYGGSSAGGYSSSSSSSGTGDWRDDFMPNYDAEDAKYDTGGDSFEKIFADMFKGAAASAATGGGGGGIFRDFVEFLEQNVDGYGGSDDDDADLSVLLQTGTVDEIGEEMDETELVVQQLTSKLTKVKDERIQVQADIAAVTRYMEKLQLQERLDELEARQGVVEGYIKRAKKRLLSLQTRYKELIVRGQNDGRAGGRSNGSSTSWEDIKRESSSSSSSSSRRSSTSSTDKEDAWKDEGFGSFGRGRGSSRRRASRRTAAGGSSGGTSSRGSASESYTSPSSARSSSSASNSSYYSSESTKRSSPTAEQTRAQEPYVAPHRRKSTFAQKQEDERRLREIKVDEEFDKLKKELGL